MPETSAQPLSSAAPAFPADRPADASAVNGRPGWPAGLLLRLIRFYQRFLSPLPPAMFGPACGCRFSPTCSHYAAAAVRDHGALAGGWLALRRLAKCTPLHRGGHDPVPPPPRLPPTLKLWRTGRRTRPNDSRTAGRPVCARAGTTSLASGL
jgi:putative membrane protein insertion efficiency factor